MKLKRFRKTVTNMINVVNFLARRENISDIVTVWGLGSINRKPGTGGSQGISLAFSGTHQEYPASNSNAL